MRSREPSQQAQPQHAIAQLEETVGSGGAQPETTASQTRGVQAGGGSAASKAPRQKQAPSTQTSKSVAAIYAAAAMRGVTPITLAMQQHGTQAVRSVLAAGACPNTPCDEGILPLQAAIQLKRADVVQALVDGGASLYLPGRFGRMPLLSAAAEGCTAVMELLLAAGVPVDQQGGECDCGCGRHGETALIVAAKKGQLAAVQLLLRRGADVRARNPKHGGAALGYSAGNGHVSVMRALLRSGADVDACNSHSKSALMQACHGGHLQAVRLLLAHNASLEFACAPCSATCQQAGVTALMLTACSQGQSEEGQAAIARVLIDAGASLDVQDDRTGCTATVYAASQGSPKVLQALVEAGANLDVVSWEGETALQVAVRRMQEALAEKDAAFYDHADVAFMLRGNGAAVDRQTREALNALGLSDSEGEQEEEEPAAAAAGSSSVAPVESPACCPGSCGAPAVCAAPGCTNTGRLRRCGGCRVVRYCGEACRDAHWREHKAECKRLQAAAAAGSKAFEAAC